MNFKFEILKLMKMLETQYGAKIYYEEYGKGEPFIHGNGGSIESMKSNRLF
jgi:hypothetical protein